MVGAGLSLLESLDVLGHQAESKGMMQTCEILVEAVRGGSDLSAAMETCPKAFPELYISMVKAGEVSGQMDIILNRLADYMEANKSVVEKYSLALRFMFLKIETISIYI